MLLRLLGPLLPLLLSLSGCSSVIVSRRLLLRHTAAAATAAALSAHPYPASAIVRGDAVGDAEAAAAGAVGLWIELSGCTVCRKDLPATCTGTLVAPDLVLSARHCIDTPASLNGTLDRLVFGADMFDAKAPTRRIKRVVTTADYGIEAAGNDLVLIQMEGRAPEPWKPIELPLGLLPSQAEQEEAQRSGSPFFPDGIGFPSLVTYGYGQQSTEGTIDPSKYSAGVLKRILVQVRTEIRPWGAGFLTTPVVKGTGTCAGDSGGAALVTLADPKSSGGSRQLVLGVQAAATTPCVDNQAIFVYPDAFAEFITRASRDLGSPIKQSLGWRDFS